MQRLNTALLIIIICVSNCFPQSDNIFPGVSSLVSEEYAFAQTSLNEGIRTAFLSFLADDAIIFTPDITNGKDWHTSRPPSDNILNWKPVFADISVSGELGYTTGPWEFSAGTEPQKPLAFGHYVSIWKKQGDNKWKVIIDIGISHTSADAFNLENISIEDIEQLAGSDMKPGKNIEENKSSLLKTDIDYAKLSKSEGFKKAFLTFASEDVRLYREEHLPAVGKTDALKLITEENNSSNWNPHNYGVSKYGDLGYSYGISEYVKSGVEEEFVKRGTYLRIWKREPHGKWQLVLDIANPFPSVKDE